MGLIRLLIIAVIFWIVFSALKDWLNRPSQPGRPSKRAGGAIEQMVKCAYCGLHVPESEAVRADGRYYCSNAHRDARSRHG